MISIPVSMSLKNSISMMRDEDSSDESDLDIESMIENEYAEMQEAIQRNIKPIQGSLQRTANLYEEVIQQIERQHPFEQIIEEIQEKTRYLLLLSKKKEEQKEKIKSILEKMEEEARQKEALRLSLMQTHDELKSNSCMPASVSHIAHAGRDISGYLSYAQRRQNNEHISYYEKRKDPGYVSEEAKEAKLEQLRKNEMGCLSCLYTT